MDVLAPLPRLGQREEVAGLRTILIWTFMSWIDLSKVTGKARESAPSDKTSIRYKQRLAYLILYFHFQLGKIPYRTDWNLIASSYAFCFDPCHLGKKKETSPLDQDSLKRFDILLFIVMNRADFIIQKSLDLLRVVLNGIRTHILNVFQSK